MISHKFTIQWISVLYVKITHCNKQIQKYDIDLLISTGNGILTRITKQEICLMYLYQWNRKIIIWVMVKNKTLNVITLPATMKVNLEIILLVTTSTQSLLQNQMIGRSLVE